MTGINGRIRNGTCQSCQRRPTNGYNVMAKLSTSLDSSQLMNVFDVVKKCKFSETKWFSLGLRLGLLKTTLDAIETEYRNDADRCLMECLSKWLSKADNVISRGGPPTWDSLSAALRAIDEIAVADQLDTKKQPDIQAIAILNIHHYSLSQSLSNPVSVARLLYGERVITGAVLANVESTGRSLSEKRKVLLAAVREAVQINYQSLQTFGTVLCKFTGNVRLGKAILSDYEKAFPDSRLEKVTCTLEDVSAPGMSTSITPSRTAAQLPAVQVSPPTIEIPILKSMNNEFSSVRAEFARMFFNVRQAIKKNPPSLDNLKDFLRSFNSDLIPKLEDADNLSSVLRLIEEECTLTDFEILEAVVQQFEIKQAEQYITKYKATLKKFCETMSARLCLKETFQTVKTHPSLPCETATYVFDWEPEERKLNDIVDILSKISGRLVKIQYIDTGR